MGGLYPSGSNYLPPAHKGAGMHMAAQVQCLDANGNPDVVNGKIVWLSIGMSNTTQETQQFIAQANAYPGKNPRLFLVDGAQGGQTASNISTPGNPNYTAFWNTVTTRLANAGVTAKQVQIIWFKEANVAGTVDVQVYHDSLVVQIKRIMNEIKLRFPNAKLCYIASRISARYATTTLNPEPYAYYTGWAVKKVIEAQINGDSQLQYAGPLVNSPWLAWGIYMWSDGSMPQATNPNIFLNCPVDFQNDGTHPSVAGAQKVGGWLLNFFSTDSTATSWFRGTGCIAAGVEKISTDNIRIYPNPFTTHTLVQADKIFNKASLAVYNAHGLKVKEVTNIFGNEFNLSRDNLPCGLYFIRLQQNFETIASQKIIITD